MGSLTNFEKADGFLFFGVPGFHGDVFVVEPEVADLVAVGVKGAEVDDGFDAEFMEVFHAFGGGLGGAVEFVHRPCGGWGRRRA